MTAQGNIINLIEYYMSRLGNKFIFDKNIVSNCPKSIEKYYLLNYQIKIVDE